MVDNRDGLVATTLAQAARVFTPEGSAREAGLAFEQALYAALLAAAEWRHNAGPNELDMAGLLQSRTGIRYEFDCALLASSTLYVVEAKRHGRITRQHISEFVSKLLDMALGSVNELSGYAIKPVFVSGLPQIDDSAWHFAVAWGIPIITPSRRSPWELLDSISAINPQTDLTRSTATDCQDVCKHLWRPLDSILHATDANSGMFSVNAHAVYDAQRVADVLEFWRECQRSANHAIKARTL